MSCALARRREEPLDVHLPDPIASSDSGLDPGARSRAGRLGRGVLLVVLDPDVVLRSDGGAARTRRSGVHTGARAEAEQAITFGRLSPSVRPALVDGAIGVVVMARDRPLSVMGFTVTTSGPSPSTCCPTLLGWPA